MSGNRNGLVVVGHEGHDFIRRTVELFPQHMQGQVQVSGIAESGKPIVRIVEPARPQQMGANPSARTLQQS